MFCLCGTVAAQDTRLVSGQVLSGFNNEPLAGATLTIYSQGKISGLVANKEGRFILSGSTDSLKVSMVGYYSKFLKKEQLLSSVFIEIRLEIAAAVLPEVTVRPLTALDVIKRAIASINTDKPNRNFQNKGFYREIIRDNDNYFSVAEAVFIAQYFPSAKDYKLQLVQGRSKEDVAFSRLFEDFHPGGGPQSVAGKDFTVSRPEFLNSGYLKDFIYKIDSLVYFDNRWFYHISFDQRPGVKKAYDKGYLLVDKETYNVLRYEVENSPAGTPYIKDLTGTDKIFAEILNIDFKRKGWKRRVDFTSVNNQWVMSYAAAEYVIGYKQPKKELDLDLTIQVELAYTELLDTIHREINKAEEWKRKNLIANLPSAFDPSFWGNHAVISPTEKIDSIISRLSQKNNDIPAVSSIAGWEYFNRNQFVTWQAADTIMMQPFVKSRWEDEETGGMLFRQIENDFIAELKIDVAKSSDESRLPDNGFQQGGLIIRNAGNENYVLMSVGTAGNPGSKLFFKKTIDGKSKTVITKLDNMYCWLKLIRKGNTVETYCKSTEQGEYKKAGAYKLDWLKGKLQFGLVAFAGFSGQGPKMKPDVKVIFTQIKVTAQ